MSNHLKCGRSLAVKTWSKYTTDPCHLHLKNRYNKNLLTSTNFLFPTTFISFPRKPLLGSGMTRGTSAKGCQHSNKYKILFQENETKICTFAATTTTFILKVHKSVVLIHKKINNMN